MSGKKIVIWSAIVLLAVLAVGFWFVSPPVGRHGWWIGNVDNNDQSVQKGDYQTELKPIVGYLTANINQPAAVIESRDKILALTVPAEYRQLHLNLVLALVHLAKKETVEQGQKELKKILEQNDWLR